MKRKREREGFPEWMMVAQGGRGQEIRGTGVTGSKWQITVEAKRVALHRV